MVEDKRLREWVEERLLNCCRIAEQMKAGKNRDGWVEDAKYFRAILATLVQPAAIPGAVSPCDKKLQLEAAKQVLEAVQDRLNEIRKEIC